LSLRTTYTPLTTSLPSLDTLSQKPQILIDTQSTWTQQEWLQCNPDERDHQQLRNWLSKDHVQSTQVLLGQKTKPKMERWIRLLKSDNLKNSASLRKTKRQQIFEILNENREIC